MGRKKKKPADKRSEYVRVMLTPGEKLEIERAAISAGLDVGTFVRTQILAIIKKKA